MDLGFALSAIIINKQKLAVIVGPEFMFQSIALSKIKVATGDKELTRQLLISFAPGVKATAYIGNQLTANLEYSACLKSNVEYDDYSNYPSQTQSTAINVKLLRLGIGLRF
jgi:hypothetical protein